MIRSMLLICTLMLSGCSTLFVSEVEAPHSTKVQDNFSKSEFNRVPLLELDLQDSYQAQVVKVDGEDWVAFPPEMSKKIRASLAAAKANNEIASDLNEVAVQLTNERNAIYLIALNEEDRANYMAKKWAIAETDLAKERRARVVQVWSERIIYIITLISIAVISG